MRIFDRAMLFCSRADPRASTTRLRRGVQGGSRDTAAASAPADSAIDHALSWLGSELRGDAIPERLRDAAGRLASLLDPQPDPSGRSEPSARGTAPVVALEEALAAKATRLAPELPVEAHGSAREQQKDSAHARDLSAGVCPFTGLRADGTLAPPAPRASSASASTVEAPAPPQPQGEPEVEARGSASEPNHELPASEASKRAGPRASEAKPTQKGKERLAGAQTVENTSGRSATRPARKQPRSRTQASRKKA